MALKKADLNRWLRRMILVEERDEGRCTKLVLRQVKNSRGGGEDVSSWKVPSAPEAEWFDEVIDEIAAEAHQDAGGVGGLVPYQVQAFYQREPDKALARFAFREFAQSDEDVEGDEDAIEPAGMKGLLNQLMRHNEAIMRTSVLATGQTMGGLIKQISRQNELIESLVDEKFKNLQVIEEAMSNKEDREFKRLEAARKGEMIRDAFDKFQALLPIIVAKLAGGKGGGPVTKESAQRDAMLKSFMASINEEQLGALTSALKPEQQVMVFEMYQSIQNEEQQAQRTPQLPAKK
jgi:hypothetical protein